MNSNDLNIVPVEVGVSEKAPIDAISAVSFSLGGRTHPSWWNDIPSPIEDKFTIRKMSTSTIKHRMELFIGEFLNNIENAPKIYKIIILLSFVALFISFTVIVISSSMVAGANLGNNRHGDPTKEKKIIPSSPISELQGLSPKSNPITDTISPSFVSSPLPSLHPTLSPSLHSISSPSAMPSSIPTIVDSATPSINPTFLPSQYLTNTPTRKPTGQPTNPKTDTPTINPTYFPTPMRPKFNPSLTFYVMGDLPFNDNDSQLLKKQINNLPDDGSFLMHVGGINNVHQDGCKNWSFERTRDILQSSTLPVFIVPGENDWNNCPNPDNAMTLWLSSFQNFENEWDHGFNVERSSKKPIFFSFIESNVLVLGIHLTGPPIINEEEWEELVRNNVIWVVRKVQLYLDDIDSIVILGHAKPIPRLHSGFTESISEACKTWQIPILYVHAGEGTYYEKSGSDVTTFDCEHITEVQVNMGRDAPPLKVSVSNSGEKRFFFDRRLPR